MDLLIHIREALHRGEVSGEMFVELCELLIAQGRHDEVLAVLGQHDSFDQLLSGSLPGASVDAGTMESGEWVNPAVSRESLEISDDVIARAAALRERASGDSRPPSKFALGEEIGRGGVGLIQLVRDRDLMRTLVMKTLIKGHDVSDYVLQKFVEEAQVTAQLEHPNIVPVHDFGFFTGGEVFFTMKLVQGRTLKDIIRKLRQGDEETLREFPRLKLLRVFQDTCMAIGFAHSRGVVHRDIKPSNIMIGDYGETLVLDWGVAKVLGRAEFVPDEEHRVSTQRSESEDATMVGVVTGTPAYMAPEQAAGKVDEVDGRSDVYALGALLYHMLTYRPPFRGKNFRQTLAAVMTQRPMPPSQRAPENEIPPRLEEICLRCLEKAPEARFQSTREIVEAIDEYLSGVEDLDRRARLSKEKLQEGVDLLEQYQRTRAQVAHVREEVMELEWHLHGYEPLDQKRGLWSKQAEFTEYEAQMHQQFAAAAQALMASIGFDPDNEQASNELARLYWIKLRQAEEENNESDLIHYRGLVEAYNRGLFDEHLEGLGRIIIRSDPPGATVTAAQYLEVDQQLTTLMEEELGRTPLNNIPLMAGRWLLTLHLDGYRDVRIPAKVERREVADVSCTFFREEEIGAHYLYVPAGGAVLGGDPACASARHRRVVQVGDFFVARYPVTCIEYLAVLQELNLQDPRAAQARVPRVKAGAGYLWPRDASGQFQLPEVDSEGFHWEQYWPVLGISFDDAQAYCEWYTRRTGVAVRLPTEEEWEKAARGVDGRYYPWGNGFDATFCKMGNSRPGQPHPERVGSFPSDVSPYGAFDMAGLVREYCGSTFGADPELRVVRGGHYATPSDTSCRVTYREAVAPGIPSLVHGFRLVRSPARESGGTQRRLVRPRF